MKFKHDMGMCKCIFKDATEIQNGRQRSTPKKIVGAKTKDLVRNYSNFTITFRTIWRCAGDFFRVLLKFKMAATDQLQFFGGRKNSKNLFGQLVLNFHITFLATCGCAIDFLKMLPKFKMTARSLLQNFLWAQKL